MKIIMDSTLDDFLNEINQIAPPKETKLKCEWQECFDKSSGFPYYWNIKTDQVTWEIPAEYKAYKESMQKSSNLYIPPKSVPLFPSTVETAPEHIKIYKIQQDAEKVLANNGSKTESDKLNMQINQMLSEKRDLPKRQNNVSSVQTKKVILLPSYEDNSDESETDDQENVTVLEREKNINDNPLPQNETVNNSDNESDDKDLLTKIQNRVKVLKELGGDLPPDVKKIVEENDDDKESSLKTQIKKDVTGFTLVAGYGDSEEDEEEEDSKSLPVQKVKPSSTLFPISTPINVKQFFYPEKQKDVANEAPLDIKAFQRKRRIGIDLINPRNQQSNSTLDTGHERQGLGFAAEKLAEQFAAKPENKKEYPSFKPGGIMFIKSDVFNPSQACEPDDKQELVGEDESGNTDKITLKKVADIQKTLNEKLSFLSEGREPASPVQIMMIQMETLHSAVTAGSLQTSYLYKWLKATCSELVKLEKEAAPSGWLLQWDRLNKRYYYRNQQTGESQWEFPHSDIVDGDDAMDISTTPPPLIDESSSISSAAAERVKPLEPPPPPRIRQKSLSPPPPPKISADNKSPKNIGKLDILPPLPPEVESVLPPLPTEKVDEHGEPLPPGVDSSEMATFEPPEENLKQLSSKTKDLLGSALDSFYSDLAAMETENLTVAAPPVSQPNLQTDPVVTEINPEVPKKKRKTKVKLAQGLSMKKKGVSKLVEKWKNVQKDYN